jgi:hypothetical protein
MDTFFECVMKGQDILLLLKLSALELQALTSSPAPNKLPEDHAHE